MELSKISILFLVLLSLNVSAQSEEITYQILNKRIVPKNNLGKLKVSLENNTTKRIILYGFKELSNTHATLEFHQKSKISIDSKVFIERDSMSFRAIPAPVTSPVKVRDLDAILKSASDTKKGKTVIIEPNKKLKIKLEYNLYAFRLEKGKYKLFLVYSCGENAKNFISLEKQKQDEESLNAEVFYGWFLSNKVDLIIK